MIYAFLQAIFGLGCLTAISIILIDSGRKQHKLNKKIELLEYMIDKDYETDKVDINNI